MIGQPIEPEAQARRCRGQDEQLARRCALAGHHQLFRQVERTAASRLPVYSIGFELYENGISRALSLDYNDFVIAGEMTALEVRPPKPCK